MSESENIDDGGPAFPGTYCLPGISLRDWFAGQAMCGYLAGDTTYDDEMWKNSDLVDCAYSLADAMLKKRGRNK